MALYSIDPRLEACFSCLESIHIALALFLHSLKLLCHGGFLSSALLELLFHAGQPLLTVLDLYNFHDQAIFRRLQPAVGRLHWRGPCTNSSPFSLFRQ